MILSIDTLDDDALQRVIKTERTEMTTITEAGHKIEIFQIGDHKWVGMIDGRTDYTMSTVSTKRDAIWRSKGWAKRHPIAEQA